MATNKRSGIPFLIGATAFSLLWNVLNDCGAQTAPYSKDARIFPGGKTEVA